MEISILNLARSLVLLTPLFSACATIVDDVNRPEYSLTGRVVPDGSVSTVNPPDVGIAAPMLPDDAKKKARKARMARTTPKPAGWPSNRHWSPRRYFGPLFGNSPDIMLNNHGAQVFYGTFLTQHDGRNIFQKYYGTNLPANPLPPPQAVPGTIPTDGFRDVALSFERLQYTSRYGGSLELTFVSKEDFQVEYRRNGQAWDIATLRMSVYVIPVHYGLNPNTPTALGQIYVEFQPSSVVGYELDASGRPTVMESDPLSSLMDELRQTATQMAGPPGSSFARETTRLAYGMVHWAFLDEIGLTNKVTAIELSDGYFFPRTQDGVGVLSVSLQVSDINLDTEPGAEEIRIAVSSYMLWGANDWTAEAYREFAEIDNGESTSFTTIGIFNLENECDRLGSLVYDFDVYESDTVSDDRFSYDPNMPQIWQWDCVGMRDRFSQGQFGLYQELPEAHFDLLQDGNVKGAMNVRIRISVYRQ